MREPLSSDLYQKLREIETGVHNEKNKTCLDRLQSGEILDHLLVLLRMLSSQFRERQQDLAEILIMAVNRVPKQFRYDPQVGQFLIEWGRPMEH